MADEPPKLSPHELARRQAIIDAQREARLIERECAREQAERRSFHKASGDPDFNLRATGGDYAAGDPDWELS